MNKILSRLMLCTACCTATVFSGGLYQNAYAQDKSIAFSDAAPPSFSVIDLDKTSLRFVGSDASFYSGSFQLEDQWLAFIKGPFAQHVLTSSLAQKYTQVFNQQWNERSGPIGELRRNLENPNIASVVGLLSDMFREEVFIFGGPELPGSLIAINKLSSEIQAVAAESPEELNTYLMSMQKEQFDAIQIPTLVFGGKISNKDLALQQIDILEALATVALANVPELQQLQDGLKRVEDQSGTRLTMTLEASMIPWDQLANNPDTAEIVTKFESLLQGRQLAISLGVFNEYIILALSESINDIAKLNSAGTSLLENDAMELVRSKSTEQIVGVGYVSDELATANFEANLEGYFSKNIGQFVAIGQMATAAQLEYTEDEDEVDKLEATLDILDSLPEDLEWLDEQIGQHVPEMKGQTSVAVARQDGLETWSEYRTENVIWESKDSLPVLQQLGGNPIGFIAARRQHHPEYFETARSIVRKVRSYLDRIVLSGV